MKLFSIAAALPLSLPLFASAATGQGRCLAAEYTLPAVIGEDMRPYLVCGMLQGNGHNPEHVNGLTVSMRGSGLDSCNTLRSRAFEAADRRLAGSIPDAAARRNFLRAEFAKADRFVAIAARSEDLDFGKQANAPACRDNNAEN